LKNTLISPLPNGGIFLLEALLVPVICIGSGVYFVVWNVLHIRDEERLLCYLQKNPKAKFWVAKFGIFTMQRTAQRYLLPVGGFVGTAILIVGLKALLMLMLMLMNT
jgi:hypothetical protein